MSPINTPSSPVVQPKSSMNMDQSTSWNGSVTGALFVICWSCAAVFAPEDGSVRNSEIDVRKQRMIAGHRNLRIISRHLFTPSVLFCAVSRPFLNFSRQANVMPAPPRLTHEGGTVSNRGTYLLKDQKVSMMTLPRYQISCSLTEQRMMEV